MQENVKSILRDRFKLSDFREGQEKVIRALLEGQSSLAVFPTGGGKSLCFQLPALLLDGLTLVISPLIALMKDQVESLQALGIMAERLDSTLTADETVDVYNRIYQGKIKLLYIAPERLSNESFLSRIKRVKVSLLVIDEAHCISGWGHNFRPEYLRLSAVSKKLNLRPILALTATATPEVSKDIIKSFEIKQENFIQRSFYRKNLSLVVTPTTQSQRLDLLAQKLKNTPQFPCIIYVTLQRTAESVAKHLKSEGLKAHHYHAGMKDELRAEVQEKFMKDELDIIVATIAFGMGIDKSNIRSVYHYNLPKSLENYQQEIGRAGRDGSLSHCEILACKSDLVVLQNFILADTPDGTSIEGLIQFIFNQKEILDLSFFELSRRFDIRPIVLETIFTYLELDELLEPVSLFYSEYDIIFLKKKEEILSEHTPERKEFLIRVFESGQMGSKWLKINLEQSAFELQEPRERIISALNWLEEKGQINIKPSGLKHRFRILPKIRISNLNEIMTKIKKQFVERESMDLERIQKVVRFVEESHCLTQHLLSYFGENINRNCGHCSNCLMLQPPTDRVVLPDAQALSFTEHQRKGVLNLIQENQSLNFSSRQWARFFCGLSSPALVREKLTRHKLFGELESYSFLEVLTWLEKTD